MQDLCSTVNLSKIHANLKNQQQLTAKYATLILDKLIFNFTFLHPFTKHKKLNSQECEVILHLKFSLFGTRLS